MIFYIGSSLLLYITYVSIDHYFPSHYIPESSAIVTRKYRIVNSVKSGVLMGLCVPGTQFIYNLLFYPELNQITILNTIGALYAATDLSALLYNPKCHNSTIFHHIIVQLFYYYCYLSNFNMYHGASRGIGIYCVISSYAFIVNFRLAIRCLRCKQFEFYINEIALFTYIAASVVNWITQIYLLCGGLNMLLIERIIYALTLGTTINDDLFLIKFLRKIDYKKHE